MSNSTIFLRRLLAGALAIAALALPAWATNGPKLTSYGSRAAGRGGVDYAYADDAIGPANNPAGMAFVYGNRLDQNWAIADPRVSWTNSFGKFDDRDELFFAVPAFSFGVTIDPTKSWEIGNLFDLGHWGLTDPPEKGEEDLTSSLSDEELTFGSRFRIGFGVFPITGGKVQIKDMRTASFNNPVDWEVDTLGLAVTPSFAYRFTRYFSLGVNLQLQYTKFELDGGIAQPRNLLDDDFEFAAIILNNKNQLDTIADIDDAFTYGFCWRIGAMFNSEYLSVGLVYQDRSYSADYLGKATVNATDEVNNLTQGNPALLQIVDPRVDPSLGFVSEYDLRIKHYEFPRMAGIGFAVRPHRRFSIGLDYTYLGWTELFQHFHARLSGGTNPNLDIITSPSIAVRVPLRYRDQHVVAVGLTGLVAEGDDIVEGVPSWALVLRAGYNYAKSPVPDDTTLPQLPVINEHHISTGFTIHWGPLLEFSAAVEYQLPKEYRIGTHIGDANLSFSKQSCEIIFVQFGMGVNF